LPAVAADQDAIAPVGSSAQDRATSTPFGLQVGYQSPAAVVVADPVTRRTARQGGGPGAKFAAWPRLRRQSCLPIVVGRSGPSGMIVMSSSKSPMERITSERG
jgi:hypothetical protein